MPIFSPLDELLVVDGLFVVIGLSTPVVVELLLFVVSVLLHPNKMAAQRTAKIKRLFLNIGDSFCRSAGQPELLWKGIEKAAL